MMINLIVKIVEMPDGSIQAQRIPQADGPVSPKECELAERFMESMTDAMNAFAREYGHEAVRKVVHHKLSDCLGGG